MGDISHVPLLCFPLLLPFHFLPSKIRFPMLVEGFMPEGVYQLYIVTALEHGPEIL